MFQVTSNLWVCICYYKEVSKQHSIAFSTTYEKLNVEIFFCNKGQCLTCVWTENVENFLLDHIYWFVLWQEIGIITQSMN